MKAHSDQRQTSGLLATLWNLPVTRVLTPADHAALRAHYKRLDDEDRMLRFFAVVKDACVDHHVDSIDWSDTTFIGHFVGTQLVAVAELSRVKAEHTERQIAELAVSVEPEWQRKGLGRSLINRALHLAQIEAIDAVQLFILPENGPMLSLVRKLGAEISRDTGQLVAELQLPKAPFWRPIAAGLSYVRRSSEQLAYDALHPSWFKGAA